MKKVFLIILGITLNLIAVTILVYFWKPISDWYLQRVPVLGIDLYNNATQVSILQQSFSFWFSGYKDIWFSGHSLVNDVPRFHYYAMLPFSNYFGLVRGIQVYTMFSFLLLVISSYLLFLRVSKNYGLAIILSVLIILSPNMYGSATWGGSIPYFATQFMFPLVLYLLISYFETRNKRWFWAGSLVSGLAFLGHILPVLAYIFPTSVIVLFLYPEQHKKWIISKRIGFVAKYFIGAIFSSYILFHQYLIGTFYDFFGRVRSFAGFASSLRPPANGEGSGGAGTAAQIASFYKDQIMNLVTGTEKNIFILLGVGIFILLLAGGAILIRKTTNRDYLIVLTLFIVAFWAGYHPYLNLSGGSFFWQGLYRAFWAFVIAIGALTSASWRPLSTFFERMGKAFLVGFQIVTMGIFVFISLFIFGSGKGATLEAVYKNSDTSSAFPEILSIKTSTNEINELKTKLTPSFLDPNDKNKRLYESDATVSIWWNALYKMPLVRGYIDPPVGTERRSGEFLLDVSIGNDTLVREFKYSEEMARKYALFMVDWFSVYFFEGGHVSTVANVGPSTYLADIFEKKEEVTSYGAILRHETQSGRPEARLDLSQTLNYYKIREELTSPVAYGSNAPAILVFADDPGYEDIWKLLAAENLNSRFVIPVKGGKYVDKFDERELKFFDAIILHNYSYNNSKKVSSMLLKYLEGGGKIFVDSGGEIKDTESNSLPTFFPISTSVRKDISKGWGFEIVDPGMTTGIDFSNFGPANFNNTPWKFSTSNDKSVKDGVKLILTNYGYPVVTEASIGKGKIIWSGINLPYHFNQYKSPDEAKFFKVMLSSLIELKDNGVVDISPKWKKPENIVVSVNDPVKGVLLKEENYDGWKVKSSAKSKIFKAGPTYPGFIYVPLTSRKPVNLVFQFVGSSEAWMTMFVNLLSVVIILEVIVFDGRLLGVRIGKVFSYVRKTVGSWWEKEEDT